MLLKYLSFENLSILKQLEIEEALLRTSTENWCLINHGSPRHIVLGNSSDPKELVNLPLALQENVPLIQRFSGGGTVVVDEDTLFVTFIIQKQAFPREILEWTGEIYREALGLSDFQVRENDYTIGDKKVGGNAQYLRSGRFLHHTSFLWDFKEKNMDLLLHPKRQPVYREERSHLEFLTKLKKTISKEEFFKKLLHSLQSRYQLEKASFPEDVPNHRKSTKVIFL